MEASLSMYTPGTIVRYDAPFKKKVCENYGVPASHPVLIMSQTTIPDSSFQCMIVSSQIDRYYGYRLYLNTMDPTYKRMSVICTNHIHTIQKKYLHDILGFIPKDLLERCRQAYAWEIGLSDQMPDYYEKDETCVGWITAGQPNIPDMPSPFDLKEGGVEAGRKVAIATGYRPYKAGAEGITNLPSYNRMVNDSIDPQVVHGMQISTQFLPPDAEPSPDKEFDMEAGRGKAPEQDPLAGTQPPGQGKSEDAPPPPAEPKKRQTHKFPRVNWELFTRIEKHQIPTYTKIAGMSEMIRKLTPAIRYDIFMRKHNGLDLHNLGLVPSRHVGDAMIGEVIKRVEEDKNAILDGAVNGSMSWRMLADRFVPALRAMSIREIRQIHMGKDKYFEILELYGFQKHECYIGECEMNDIYADQLSAEQMEGLGIPVNT